MNNKVINFTMFVLGATVGSVVTWQYIKKKYEQIAQDEIDSVKETFSKREIKNDGVKEIQKVGIKSELAKERPNITEYVAKLQEEGYTNYSTMKKVIESTNKEEEETEPMLEDKPHVISPDDFGEFDDYEQISLIYYSDNILADDNDELVEDVEEVVGFESLATFGEYEDDSVFVRNDKLKCDYEILSDQRKFSDVVKKRPHGLEDY